MNDLDKNAEVINGKIDQADKILVVASRPVDYDSLGTTLAMHNWLKSLGKDVKAYLFAEIPGHIEHFPEIQTIEQKYVNDVDLNFYDLIILVDGNEFRQFFTNEYKKILKDIDLGKIVSIDHHLPGKIEEELGEQCLRKQECCTAKVFYDYFLKPTGSEILPNVAQLMYMALIGDTAVFQHGIYFDTFRFAQLLIDADADHDRAVSLSIPREMMEFTAWGIQNMKYSKESLSTILVIDEKKKNELADIFGEEWEKLDILRYYTNVVMRMVEGFPYSIILSTAKDEANIRLIYRIKNYGADVNLMEILNEHGFGLKGHLRAGSGSINGSIEEVEKKYIEIMSKAISEGN